MEERNGGEREEGRGSIAATNERTVGTVRSATTVHRGLKVWEVKGQEAAGWQGERREETANKP